MRRYQPRQEPLPLDDGPHTAHWAHCPECTALTRQLEAEGLTTSDAQGVAEATHAKVRDGRVSP
jgi:hypothetical protein